MTNYIRFKEEKQKQQGRWLYLKVTETCILHVYVPRYKKVFSFLFIPTINLLMETPRARCDERGKRNKSTPRIKYNNVTTTRNTNVTLDIL